jgi:DNA-binding MarR family transcriptional regulator
MTTRDHSRELSPGEYEALAGLRHVLRKFTAFSASEVLKLDLTPQQHQALLAIKGLVSDKEMTAGMLADTLLIAPRAAAALIEGLADAGYVECVPRDGGQEGVRLLGKAETALARLSDAHLHEIRDMAPELMHALRILQDRERLEKIAWMA